MATSRVGPLVWLFSLISTICLLIAGFVFVLVRMIIRWSDGDEIVTPIVGLCLIGVLIVVSSVVFHAHCFPQTRSLQWIQRRLGPLNRRSEEVTRGRSGVNANDNNGSPIANPGGPYHRKPSPPPGLFGGVAGVNIREPVGGIRNNPSTFTRRPQPLVHPGVESQANVVEPATARPIPRDSFDSILISDDAEAEADLSDYRPTDPRMGYMSEESLGTANIHNGRAITPLDFTRDARLGDGNCFAPHGPIERRAIPSMMPRYVHNPEDPSNILDYDMVEAGRSHLHHTTRLPFARRSSSASHHDHSDDSFEDVEMNVLSRAAEVKQAL
jgi:hypothetical protein